MSVFIKRGYFCVVPRETNEIRERYIFRGYTIISQRPKTQSEFDKTVRLSRYLNNITFLGCQYIDSIMEDCEYLKNLLFNN